MDGVTRLREVAGECAAAAVWPLSDREVADCLAGAYAAQQQATAAVAHLVRQAQLRDLPAKEGATSAAVWLRDRLHLSMAAAHRLVKLGEALDKRPVLDAAVSDGAVSAEQATVIAAVLADLPAEAGTEAAQRAERALIGFADRFDPRGLSLLGGRVLAHVAPEVAQRRDAEALERLERKAQQGRGFTLTPLGDGRVRLHGHTGAADAAAINAALDPLCHPRADTDTDGPPRTAAQRRHDALLDLCTRALRAGDLPETGGDAAQVVITVDWHDLLGQIGSAVLDTGQPISAAEARRLACAAGILPAVLSGAGQVLDLGQQRRLFTGALRRALVLRDRGCAFPSCDRPAAWCDGHHIQHWADGGPTCLANAALLCGHHHRLIHRGDWTVRIATDGLPEFIPPSHVDPQQRPRRNTYHRRE